jgi:hypothetical protein
MYGSPWLYVTKRGGRVPTIVGIVGTIGIVGTVVALGRVKI